MFSKNLKYLLFSCLFLFLILFLSCGGSSSDTVIVTSSDGKVLLHLSSSDSTKANQISITPITDGVPAGVVIYSFEPSGLQFENSARVEFDVSDTISRDNIQPVFLISATDNEVDVLDNQDLEITPSGAKLYGDLDHFSLVAYSYDSNISATMTPVPTSLNVGESFSSNYTIIVNANASASVAKISYLTNNTAPITPTAPDNFITSEEFTKDGTGGLDGTSTGGLLVGIPAFKKRSIFTGTIEGACRKAGTGLFRTVFGFLNFRHELNLGLAFQSISALGLLTIADNTVDKVRPRLLYQISLSEEITCVNSETTEPTPIVEPTEEATEEPSTEPSTESSVEPSTEPEEEESTEPQESTTPGIEISKTTFVFNHDVGITDCPQSIGSFVVTNTGNETLNVTVSNSSGSTNLLNLSTNSFSLAPGQSKTVNVSFNCGQPSSFSAEFLVQGTGSESGQKVSSGVSITGNVG